MSRASSFARSLGQPPLIGAAYVLVLAAWAAQSVTVDERAGGAQARQIQAVVQGRFGGEIGRVGVAILATSIVLGALLGWAAWGLVALRDVVLEDAPSRSAIHEATLVLVVVATMHGLLELWGMAHDPPLYADAWYARGGLRRTVQVLATDVLGPGGTVALMFVAFLAFLAGPPSRWRQWPSRLARFGRRLADVGAVGAAGGGALTLLFLVLTIPRAHAAPADARPNILVLAADSLRADRLDPRTAPHLSALADRGTRFDRAYVSLPRTFPSWVTLLTGRHPHHHGIRSMFPRWEERAHDFDALPGRLARAGYATGVVSDYAGDVFSRIDLGFGLVDVPEFDFRQLVRQRALERETPLMPVLHSRLGRAAFPVMREMNDAADPTMLARDAVRTMRRLEGRGPFMLVVFFSTAHFPYAAPAPYYRRFTDEAYRGRYKYDKPVGLGQDAPADARDEAQVRALYDGAVSAIDDAAQPSSMPRHTTASRARPSWWSRPTTARPSTITATAWGTETISSATRGPTSRSSSSIRARPRLAATARSSATWTSRPRSTRSPASRRPGTSTGSRSSPRSAANPCRPNAPTPRRASGSPRTSRACRARCDCPTPESRDSPRWTRSMATSWCSRARCAR